MFLGDSRCNFLYEFYPVKFSVKKENISGKEYILASPYDITTTVANWKITGDEHGLVNLPYYVSMQGNKPQGFNLRFIRLKIYLYVMDILWKMRNLKEKVIRCFMRGMGYTLSGKKEILCFLQLCQKHL